MRAHPAQTSFNAGELSPLLMGRPDLAKFSSGCQIMENMIATVQGPAKRRGGSRMKAHAKNDAKVWLGRFKFTRMQSYLLEFGAGYIRFYANRAQLVNGSAPVEVVTPYSAGDLTNEDGSFNLSLKQDGDVIYIASGSHPPKVLTRLGAIDWTFADLVTRNGPLQDQNSNKALRLYAEARTGSSVNVTASANYFTAAMVGAFLRIDVENFTMPPWEPQKVTAVNDIRRSDGKTYIAKTGGATRVTGSRTPIHEEGTVLDGSGTVEILEVEHDIGVEWEFRDAGYGLAKIVSITSPTVAVVAVVADLPFPDHVIGSGNASNVWQIGAWGTHAGAEWPRHVFFWKQRLGFAGLRRFWLSVPSDFSASGGANFARDIVGQVRADSAITRDIQTTDKIRWVCPTDAGLIFGCEGSEWIVRKGTEAEALGPANIDADEKSTYGSRALQPMKIGDAVLFPEPAGQNIREARADSDSGAYEAPDITVLAEHIASGVIVDWDWQQSPDRVLWVVTADGELLGFTKEREQDVFAGHRHPTRGLVEAVKVVPSPDGKRDDVWIVVQRTIAGVPKRFVEVLDAGDSKGRAQEDCYFLDCGLTYSGAAITLVSGLLHLAGETVDVVVNGAAHPPRVVSAAGTITLQAPATKVHVGFGFRSALVPMPIEAGSRLGTAQGKTKRVNKLQIRFHRTLGCKVGPNENNLSPVPFRYGRDPLGSPPPLFTGISEPIDFEGDYEKDGTIWIVQDQPLPMTVCALMPELVTYERS